MEPVIAFAQQDFALISDLIGQHALAAPRRAALIEGPHSLDYGALDVLMDRIAAALQRDGLKAGDAIAICAAMSIEYAAVFLGASRVGVVVAPLAPGSTPASLAGMISDAQARTLFVDAGTAELVSLAGSGAMARVTLDGSPAGPALNDWLARRAG